MLASASRRSISISMLFFVYFLPFILTIWCIRRPYIYVRSHPLAQLAGRLSFTSVDEHDTSSLGPVLVKRFTPCRRHATPLPPGGGLDGPRLLRPLCLRWTARPSAQPVILASWRMSFHFKQQVRRKIFRGWHREAINAYFQCSSYFSFQIGYRNIFHKILKSETISGCIRM